MFIKNVTLQTRTFSLIFCSRIISSHFIPRELLNSYSPSVLWIDEYRMSMRPEWVSGKSSLGNSLAVVRICTVLLFGEPNLPFFPRISTNLSELRETMSVFVNKNQVTTLMIFTNSKPDPVFSFVDYFFI